MYLYDSTYNLPITQGVTFCTRLIGERCLYVKEIWSTHTEIPFINSFSHTAYNIKLNFHLNVQNNSKSWQLNFFVKTYLHKVPNIPLDFFYYPRHLWMLLFVIKTQPNSNTYFFTFECVERMFFKYMYLIWNPWRTFLLWTKTRKNLNKWHNVF